MLSRLKNLFALSVPRANVIRNAAQAVEILEDRKLMAASFDLGININDGSTAAMKMAIPHLKKLGVKSVRVWYSVYNYNDRTFGGSLQRAVDYAAAGFDVMLAVVPKDGRVPTAESVRGWFSWASNNSALRNAVDRWQIGNEPDHDSYWRGSMSQYVTQMLKPASEALRAKGEQVVSAGPSWNPEDVREMVEAGLINHVDYVGYHPYGDQKGLAGRLAKVKDVIGGRKPMIASEWNVRGFEKNPSAWSEAVEEVYPQIRSAFAINYYFGLIQKTTTMAGPGGILTLGGTPTRFYNALAKAKGSTPVEPEPKPDPEEEKPDVGNKPSTTKPAPRISALQLINSGSEKVVGTYNNITGNISVKLSSLTSRNIALAAVANSGTESVKISAFGKSNIENGAPYRGNTFVARAGTFYVSAQAFAKDDLKGTIGNTFGVTITFY